MMSTIAAIVTVHDPDDRLRVLTERHLPEISPLYHSFIARCSTATADATRRLLTRYGIDAQCDTGLPEGAEHMGLIRLAAVRAGLQTEAEYLHLCDFDRLLHWQMAYPEELRSILAEIARSDLTVLGRTARAFETHPVCQIETERLANRVFELTTGQAWDIAGGSRGLSRRAGERLLAQSGEAHFGVDAEWPILLRAAPGFRVTYRACEGLEFETPDRFADEVAAAGSVQHWIAQMDGSATEWTRRLQFAWWTAEAATRTVESARARPLPPDFSRKEVDS